MIYSLQAPTVLGETVNNDESYESRDTLIWAKMLSRRVHKLLLFSVHNPYTIIYT